MGVVELFPLPPDDELVVEGVLFGEVLVILYFLFIVPDDPPPPLLLLLQPLLFFKVELSGVDKMSRGDIIPPIPESSKMDFSDAKGDARGIRWGCNGTDNGDANVFGVDVDTKVESSVPNP